MATLREIQLRLKSVSNIAKITKSMKMIAATKLTRAQKNMEVARAYGESSNDVYTQADTAQVMTTGEANKSILITVSSDRGLCGGIHSSVSKATKRLAAADRAGSKIVILGDKAKAQLQRELRAEIQLSFNQIGKATPTFAEACAVADTIRAEGVEFDRAEMIYNQFRSVIAYEATQLPVYSVSVFKQSPKYAQYEVDEEVLDNYAEFTFANALYWGLTEGHAAEMAAKRTAMENATKNAGEMIDKLTLTYNRGRQAVITNELIDIITGASAL